MAPRPEQARALRVEQHHERLRYRVDLQAVVGAPRGGGSVGVEREALQDAPEAHPVSVEDPGAVAGLEDEQRVACGGDHIADHARSFPGFGVESTSASLRNCDNTRLPSST